MILSFLLTTVSSHVASSSVCMTGMCMAVSFISFFCKPQCCQGNQTGSLLHGSGSQWQHSGNLLTLGRLHKIGIIAVDYGKQWAAASERFIHPCKKKKEAVKGGGGQERGASVPPPLSHGGHRHNISGLKDLAFWTCSLPLTIALLSLSSEPPPTPASFLAAASLDAALGWASWGHCHCLRVKQRPSKPRGRKQRASHGTSQKLWWLPQPSPHRPLFWLRGAGVTPVPLSPLVFLSLPPVTPSSQLQSFALISKTLS